MSYKARKFSCILTITYWRQKRKKFLSPAKIVPLEVKSSGIGKHESITEFQKKYSQYTANGILLSQKDAGSVETLKLYLIYMLPFIVEEL